MNYAVIAFTRLLGAVALSTLIAACGSGGGDTSTDGTAVVPPAVPSDTFRITCTVYETANLLPVPVDNALVLLNVKDTSYNATTGSDGKCVLEVPAAAVTGLTQVAVSVVKDGFEPAQFVCETTTTACNKPVVLVRITPNTSLPENGDVVTHIGDGTFDGQINSQLQTDKVGSSADFTITDWGTKLLANPGWTRATVVLDAKGWQTTVAPGCDNKIAIVGDVGSPSQAGGDSNSDGDWTPSKNFEFDIAQVGRTGAPKLRITSGLCGTSTVDIDDFETNRIRVYYCDDATVGACVPKP